MRGPLILVTNHVNIWEIPIMYSKLQPRSIHGLVLADRWKNKILAWILNTCEAIPLERGGTNLDSLRRAIEVLEKEEIVVIAPEGTRSGDGHLQRGYAGVVILALKSKAPLLPVVFYGSDSYRRNLRKFRRTDFHVVVGEPISLSSYKPSMSRQERQAIADEIMCKLAEILPENYRGEYAGGSFPAETVPTSDSVKLVNI